MNNPEDSNEPTNPFASRKDPRYSDDGVWEHTTDFDLIHRKLDQAISASLLSAGMVGFAIATMIAIVARLLNAK